MDSYCWIDIKPYIIQQHKICVSLKISRQSMIEKIKNDERYSKRTNKLYRSALICHLIPFMFLGIFALDMFLLHKTEMLFWRIFLLSMFPFGLLGLLFSIIGIVQATNIQNLKKKTTGYYTLVMGIIVVAGGILGWMLLYVVIS